MFLTENLANIILFVSYIFAMLVFLMLLIEKIVESLFHYLPFLNSPISFSLLPFIFPLLLISSLILHHFPFLSLLHFCMNLLFLHPNPRLALFQLLFLSLFLITTPIYLYASLLSFYPYIRKRIHRYFFSSY